MRLAVIGAAGRIGSRIVKEALGRGHEVTMVVRNRSGLDGTADRLVEADVFDSAAVKAAVAGADVVVNAAGHAAKLDDAGFYARAARSVVSALRAFDDPPRLIVVGGFGSVRDGAGGQYADRPNLPANAAPEIVGQREALTYYRTLDDLHWTYVSPPPGGIAPGQRSGKYQLAVDTIGDREAASTLISMEDYAIAVLDEAERAEHPHACVVVMR
ncbi:NAD(P)-dependent oxidoreductase [Rhizocola hellebori]|uniref:NAD(P)-dependent oxidoreductase n=1 Tax=Rhizocola hellebori TaxID=1392758 RepID=UPI001944C31B|nr:NAD(P)H-binding protein [Rhizocola hellebori]